MKLAKERGGFGARGSKFLWCVAQIAALSPGQGRTPLSAAPAWNGSFGSLCSTSFLLFNTKKMDRRGPGSLCLSDPLNFIMKELLNPLYPSDTSSFICAFPLPWSRGIFPFSLWRKREKNKGLDFHGLNASGEIPTYVTNVDVPFAFSCPTCPAGELCIQREQKLFGLWD